MCRGAGTPQARRPATAAFLRAHVADWARAPHIGGAYSYPALGARAGDREALGRAGGRRAVLCGGGHARCGEPVPAGGAGDGRARRGAGGGRAAAHYQQPVKKGSWAAGGECLPLVRCLGDGIGSARCSEPLDQLLDGQRWDCTTNQ